MIPSDHFVYFYNEIFKFLQRKGRTALERYYARVADRQANFTLDTFRRNGLKGLYDYWERIRIEENCVMETRLEPSFYHLRMMRCPSLTKALESDAGPCSVYCDHCPGWILRVFSMAGVWGVYDIVDRTDPVCEIWAFEDRELARRKADELLAFRGPDLVRTNLDVVPPFLASSLANADRFLFMNPNFKTAFSFIRTADLPSLEPGKIEIDGDRVFAYVSEPALAPLEEGRFEAHRRYIDIHVPIAGPETIATFTLSERERALPFNEKDDYVLFEAKGEPLTLLPGEFIAFFPPFGGHKPGRIAQGAARRHRKICVKVKA